MCLVSSREWGSGNVKGMFVSCVHIEERRIYSDYSRKQTTSSISVKGISFMEQFGGYSSTPTY